MAEKILTDDDIKIIEKLAIAIIVQTPIELSDTEKKLLESVRPLAVEMAFQDVDSIVVNLQKEEVGEQKKIRVTLTIGEGKDEQTFSSF